MRASADAVADCFLLLAAKDNRSIDPLILQKLLYYAQAYHLAAYGEPLFPEQIKAWRHGPVIPCIWQRFREYGDMQIDVAESKNPVAARSEAGRFIAEAWEAFGHMDGWTLRERTHAEAPWRDAHGDTPPGERCAEVISYDAMRSYYLDHYEPWQPGYATSMARAYEDADRSRAAATRRTSVASARALYSR